LYIIPGLVLVLLFTVFSFDPVSAINPNLGLTLSPLRSEYNIAPGTSQNGVLTVVNKSDQPMEVSLTSEEFRVINQQYDYAFNADSNLSEWIKFNTGQVSLSPGATKTITYTLAVPLSAEPGGRYISLFASNDTESTNGGISSRQRIASLIYLTVTGDVTREGHLLSLNSPLIIGTSGSWSAVLQNTGSTHFRSRYNIETKTIFGGQVSSTTGEALILPGTVRSLSGDLQLPRYPGVYKLIYTIGLGDTPAVTVTKYEIYLPIVTFAILGAIVVSVVLLTIFIRSRRHKV